jgi:Tfp pilus assembly protein PilE
MKKAVPEPSPPVLARARDERGFGMIEMVTAMTVMLVGVLAVFALFQSGLVQIRRASTVTTAAALASAEMERFRAVKYATLGLDPGATTDAVYTADQAYSADTSPTTTVNGTLSTGGTTLTVSSAAGFPPTPEFRVKIGSEILLVTAVSGTTWTVGRGYDGTNPAAYTNGTTVTLKRRVDVEACPGSGLHCTELVPTKNTLGADGRTYRVDTYVTWTEVTNQSGTAGRALKRITVVVRDANAPYREWARGVSVFDEATGL